MVTLSLPLIYSTHTVLPSLKVQFFFRKLQVRENPFKLIENIQTNTFFTFVFHLACTLHVVDIWALAPSTILPVKEDI